MRFEQFTIRLLMIIGTIGFLLTTTPVSMSGMDNMIPLDSTKNIAYITVVGKAWCSSENYPAFLGESNCTEVWLRAPGYGPAHDFVKEGKQPSWIDLSNLLGKLNPFNPSEKEEPRRVVAEGADFSFYNVPIPSENLLWIIPNPSVSVNATMIVHHKGTWGEFTCTHNFKLSKPWFGDNYTIGEWGFFSPARQSGNNCQRGSVDIPE